MSQVIRYSLPYYGRYRDTKGYLTKVYKRLTLIIGLPGLNTGKDVRRRQFSTTFSVHDTEALFFRKLSRQMIWEQNFVYLRL